jgi:replicative DNA helicase
LPIWIDDKPGLTLLELRAKIRRVQVENDQLKAVYVDYLQLMRGSAEETKQGREREIGGLAQGLKETAKDTNVAIVALAQLNRQVEQRGENAAPRLSDLRESGAIEQAADNVALLYEVPDPTQVATPVTWLLAKQRSGPTGECSLLFDKRYTRFMER